MDRTALGRIAGVRQILKVRAEIHCEAQRIRCERRGRRGQRIRRLELRTLHAIRRSRRLSRRNYHAIHPAAQPRNRSTRRSSPQPQRDASYRNLTPLPEKGGAGARSRRTAFQNASGSIDGGALNLQLGCHPERSTWGKRSEGPASPPSFNQHENGCPICAQHRWKSMNEAVTKLASSASGKTRSFPGSNLSPRAV
jgi:hypothetical protein